MFRNLRLKKETPPPPPEPAALAVQRLVADTASPVSLRAINQLPANAQRRIYRGLLPPDVLMRFEIDPISWRGPDGDGHVELHADADKGTVRLSAKDHMASPDPFFWLELEDNNFNGIELKLLLLNDPSSQRFSTDVDAEGRETQFGTVRRNLAAEAQAMQAGLAPGQFRASLKASSMVFDHLETFLIGLGHKSIGLEPLTYASAWVFERRGFAYVRGHKLMDTIHAEFQPGGKLHAALDGSTPFRQPDQWRTVRGRAWAIADGILAAIDNSWNNIRMMKQVGRPAHVETFPGAVY